MSSPDLTVRDGLGGLPRWSAGARDMRVVASVSGGYSSDPVMADHERYGFGAKVLKLYTPEVLDATIAPLVGGGGACRWRALERLAHIASGRVTKGRWAESAIEEHPLRYILVSAPPAGALGRLPARRGQLVTAAWQSVRRPRSGSRFIGTGKP